MSSLPKPITCSLCTGAVAYVSCLGLGLSRPWERAVLVAIHVGLAETAHRIIKSQTGANSLSKHRQPSRLQGKVSFLSKSAYLAVLPVTLFAGHRLHFKVPDYLHLAGLIWITSQITKAGADFYKWKIQTNN